uniref:60S acidic ribosomal protein n=1 Tax=Saccharum hybrid cultivar R570 TaxID=131158 RepID=A0A059Q365_9POAL|nr:60S acidic ribosomal protein [Saccharum hybrid cultivar R570]
MKFAAAYLLACLGAEQAAAAAALPAPAPALPPTKDDVRRILGSVGAEVEEDRLDLLFALMDGKDVAELIAAGREQLAYAPSGAAAVVAAPAAAAAKAEAAEEEAKKEEAKKEEEEEEDDDVLFNLFD